MLIIRFMNYNQKYKQMMKIEGTYFSFGFLFISFVVLYRLIKEIREWVH